MGKKNYLGELNPAMNIIVSDGKRMATSTLR